MAELQTVRIPELVSQSTLSLDDKIVVYVDADGKTRHATLLALYNLIYSGEGGGSYDPVYLGGSVIYDVPPELDGTTTAAIPALAGKDFLLRRQGRAMKPGTEYEILNAGGFKLKLTGDVLFGGERFELDVFSLQTGPAPAPGTGGGSGITGVVPITTNLTLNAADHLSKLLQIRSGSTAITLTLFDIDDPDVPDNTIVEIEGIVNVSRQCKITTQGGQNIYMRGTSYNSVYLAPGETIKLFKGDDGWYVLDNGLPQIYDRIGIIESAYKVGRNQLLCDGSLVSRDQYPRLWEIVQTFGASLVSDTTWNTASVTHAGQIVPKPYRGCFSTGNGTTTFRLPDLRNVALRGLQPSDTQRYYNNAGGFQRNQLETHNHNDLDMDNSGHGSSSSPTNADTKVLVNIGGGDGHSKILNSRTGYTGGPETRMDNTAVLWVVNA